MPVEYFNGSDLSWKGWGWCSATTAGPIACGWVKLSGKKWRMGAALDYMNGDFAVQIADLEMRRLRDDPPVRIVLEEPPMVYAGRGNQAAIGYGLGRLAGALELWSLQRGTLAYPWPIPCADWREWMKVGGKGRLGKKLAAVELVRALGWGRFLAPFPWDEGPEAFGGAQGDVAEAILLTVGAARHSAEAPAGPRRAAA